MKRSEFGKTVRLVKTLVEDARLWEGEELLVEPQEKTAVHPQSQPAPQPQLQSKSRFQNAALEAKPRILSQDRSEISRASLSKDVREISHRTWPKAGVAAPNGHFETGS